ncbi:MAG: type II toxin-antitoxin system prevent-host-death family antitoxin [Planctomycetes bacterium]|nr:type II toxin-antitoxin system prevent-host-death family antitoxin [Planctomycetota bacterium]
MIHATIHQAKTHLSKLIKQVQGGETVVILHGKAPVAKLVPFEAARGVRPKVGKPTTRGVRWTEDAFKPLTEEELEAWGL